MNFTNKPFVFNKTNFIKTSLLTCLLTVSCHLAVAQQTESAPPKIIEHSLKGKWNWLFLDTNALHQLTINDVQHFPTHSNAYGTIQSLNEQCPVDLTVYNSAKTQLIDNNNSLNVNHDGHVIINIKCKNATVVAMGYGLPSAVGSVVGRADVKITGEKKATPQPFMMSRSK